MNNKKKLNMEINNKFEIHLLHKYYQRKKSIKLNNYKYDNTPIDYHILYKIHGT